MFAKQLRLNQKRLWLPKRQTTLLTMEGFKMETTLSTPAQDTSPAGMIRMAVAGGADLEKLKGLLDLQIQFEANEARKAYASDFATTQAKIEPATKRLRNKQTNSTYADLSGVIETAQPIYTSHGFAVRFNEGDCPKEGYVRILADVLHRAGHSENYHFDVPLDGKGLRGNENMTAIHGKASSVTYGRRYLMCMIWNIPTSDIDGNVNVAPCISDKQVKELLNLLQMKDLSESNLIKFMGVETLEDIKESEYMKALSAINSAKKKGA